MKRFRSESVSTGVLLLCLIPYIPGLFVPVMEVDAAQYASISMEMQSTGEYLQVQHRHQDYLDKPPLLFWLSSASFHLFGISTWAYKLPSVVSILLAAFSTYRLGRLFYEEAVARNAALIILTTLAFYSIGNDVRTDTLLAAFVITGTEGWIRYIRTGNIVAWFCGTLSVALAMLAKGPIGIVAPVLALGSHILYTRDFKAIFTPLWIVSVFLIALLLFPMVWGLQEQYGSHGPAFYFWEQSFGRITGENVWKNDAGPFFFVHTFLWAFFPWTIPFIFSFILFFYSAFKNKFSVSLSFPEAVSAGGFLLPFVALSFSSYKLPHYIYVTFPFAALLCASGLKRFGEIKWLSLSLILPAGLFVLLCIVLSLSFDSSFIQIAGVIVLFTGAFLLLRDFRFNSLVAVLSATGFGLLNLFFYPQLLGYQSGREAALLLNKKAVPINQSGLYEVSSHSFDFYRLGIVPYYNYGTLHTGVLIQGIDYHLYTNDEGLSRLPSEDVVVKEIQTLPHHHPGLLTLAFLNPSTRSAHTEARYLVTVQLKQ